MSDSGREAPSPAAAPTSPEPRPDEQQQVSADIHPPFEPLFTLLMNTSTNATIHPRVHYLFSDDDPSILSSAVAAANSSDRALIVDLAPRADASGWGVSWASSLTPDFSVTDAQLQQPEQQQQEQQPQQQSDGMLRLTGVEREPVDVKKAAGDGSGMEDVDALMEEFRRRMGVLRKVVGEGERRREVLRREEEEEEEELKGLLRRKEMMGETGWIWDCVSTEVLMYGFPHLPRGAYVPCSRRLTLRLCLKTERLNVTIDMIISW